MAVLNAVKDPFMEEQTPTPDKKPDDKQKIVGLLMFEAGMEFAFLIAVPLVAGIFGGKWLDRKYNHHFFVVIGILLGLAISVIAIYKRILDYKRMLK